MRALVGAAAIAALLVLAACTPDPVPDRTDSAPSPIESPTPTPSPDWRPIDSGPREGAMGPTTIDERGVPLTYTVVEGDTADLIRLRFDIWWDSLASEDGTVLDKYPVLYVGDVLTFVPPTVSQESEHP